MRVLKNGEVKYKPSSYAGEIRLREPILPLTARRIGEAVEVYMGCGWSKGYVTTSLRDRCVVRLARTQTSTICYDNRNIRTAKAK